MQPRNKTNSPIFKINGENNENPKKSSQQLTLEALQSLGLKYRMPLWLVFYEKLSVSESAFILSMKERFFLRNIRLGFTKLEQVLAKGEVDFGRVSGTRLPLEKAPYSLKSKLSEFIEISEQPYLKQTGKIEKKEPLPVTHFLPLKRTEMNLNQLKKDSSLKSTWVFTPPQALGGNNKFGKSSSGFSPLNKSEAFTIVVAAEQSLRERAYKLAYQAYFKKGYIQANSKSWMVNKYDARPSTFTLLVQDSAGEDAGTMTLNFDEDGKLPCEDIFSEEVNKIKSKGRRFVEVTKICISEKHLSSRELLVQMFNLIYIYSYKIRKYSNFVIEVNPRHCFYYKKLLGFEVHGQPKICPRVSGAPAVFLNLDLTQVEDKIKQAKVEKSRQAYRHFFHEKEELFFTQFLKGKHLSMSVDEKIYFGLAKNLKPTEV